MARRMRVEYRGALYHVITRGNQGQKIFSDDRDRKKYLELLLSLKEAYAFRIHAYVLMLNHIHLLLETGEVGLSRIMQRLGSGYTQYFNRRHKIFGHLFQGRYKAILCDKDNYLLELTRYLHLNPVRAKAVKRPEDYVWSSYGAYVKQARHHEWIDSTEVLGQFSRRPREAREHYRRFVLEAIDMGHREEYYQLHDGRFLGEREFAEDVKTRAGEQGKVRIRVKPEQFVDVACKALGKKRDAVIGAGKERARVRAREVVCYTGRRCTELSVKSLAEILRVDPTCVSRSVARVEGQLAKDKRLKSAVENITTALENSKYQA